MKDLHRLSIAMLCILFLFGSVASQAFSQWYDDQGDPDERQNMRPSRQRRPNFQQRRGGMDNRRQGRQRPQPLLKAHGVCFVSGKSIEVSTIAIINRPKRRRMGQANTTGQAKDKKFSNLRGRFTIADKVFGLRVDDVRFDDDGSNNGKRKISGFTASLLEPRKPGAMRQRAQRQRRRNKNDKKTQKPQNKVAPEQKVVGTIELNVEEKVAGKARRRKVKLLIGKFKVDGLEGVLALRMPDKRRQQRGGQRPPRQNDRYQRQRRPQRRDDGWGSSDGQRRMQGPPPQFDRRQQRDDGGWGSQDDAGADQGW